MDYEHTFFSIKITNIFYVAFTIFIISLNDPVMIVSSIAGSFEGTMK